MQIGDLNNIKSDKLYSLSLTHRYIEFCSGSPQALRKHPTESSSDPALAIAVRERSHHGRLGRESD